MPTGPAGANPGDNSSTARLRGLHAFPTRRFHTVFRASPKDSANRSRRTKERYSLHGNTKEGSIKYVSLWPTLLLTREKEAPCSYPLGPKLLPPLLPQLLTRTKKQTQSMIELSRSEVHRTHQDIFQQKQARACADTMCARHTEPAPGPMGVARHCVNRTLWAPPDMGGHFVEGSCASGQAKKKTCKNFSSLTRCGLLLLL